MLQSVVSMIRTELPGMAVVGEWHSSSSAPYESSDTSTSLAAASLGTYVARFSHLRTLHRCRVVVYMEESFGVAE